VPIGHYGLIGDCRSAALVSNAGSIDWLCLPRFDSPSIFARLLDEGVGGHFSIRPAGPFQAEQRYLPATNVLTTTFTTPDGELVLTDLMPVASEPEKRSSLHPDHEVLRQVRGVRGEVRVELEYAPRPDYARVLPRLRSRGALGVWTDAGKGALGLVADSPLKVTDTHMAQASFTLCAGESRAFSLLYTEEAPAIIPSLGPAVTKRLDRTVSWWSDWSEACTYRGPYREAVVRSLLALKLLTYAPSGAIVAAPTTSLPEELGGVRNWDYRYCWLRDASLTMRALLTLGYHDEARAFCSWLLYTTRQTWPELRVLYDVFGGNHLRERELTHLGGYAASGPVRVGNGAHEQLQLDVYGELIDAVTWFLHDSRHVDRDTRHMLAALGETVCARWAEPDEGIWEVRSGRFHHTHSKVLCWVALDRLLKAHDAGALEVPVERFRAARDAIRAEIETRGYNESLQSYTRTFDGEEIDAALLLLPIYGYTDGHAARMQSTVQHIRAGLGTGPFLYRYQPGGDGLPGGEGAFGIASFWAVEALARAGEVRDATATFEALLSHATGLGLYGEEFDVSSGEPLGNFPQAFTHVGLINAALTLEEINGRSNE
jgi:GH15 family glucan-1,4-alpha-glucosidase